MLSDELNQFIILLSWLENLYAQQINKRPHKYAVIDMKGIYGVACETKTMDSLFGAKRWLGGVA